MYHELNFTYDLFIFTFVVEIVKDVWSFVL